MATRGFLIRFIDIGLIVLFGFLMISDIDASTRVELGSAADAQEIDLSEQDPDQGFLVVAIGPDASFTVSDPRLGDEAPLVVRDLPSLGDVLTVMSRRHSAAGSETVVVIQPDPASPVQATVDAMDVCDRLGLAKSLRMDIEVEAPVDDSVGAGTTEPDTASAGAGPTGLDREEAR